jgi:hypothetical protein
MASDRELIAVGRSSIDHPLYTYSVVSTGLRLASGPLSLEGKELVKGSFLRRNGSFGGRSKITQAFTSNNSCQQSPCREEQARR